MEIWLFKLQHTQFLEAQPRQHISNIYIYLYVSDQSVYTGPEKKHRLFESFIKSAKTHYAYKLPRTKDFAKWHISSSSLDIRPVDFVIPFTFIFR